MSQYKLKQINSIQIHDKLINSLKYFPSGNIISASTDLSIKIFDINFNIIQIINNAHYDRIMYIEIINENTFITCSYDKSIKIWNKKKEYYVLNIIIKNAHNDYIIKVIYNLNGNLISCSRDKTIKIWELKNNNKYQNLITLVNKRDIFSIIIIENKNILVSSGFEGTKFWNLNNFELIYYNRESKCLNKNALQKINDDTIIIGGEFDFLIRIISIKEKKIIYNIKNDFICYGICVIENEQLFLIGGFNDIKIYNSNNFELIQTIKNAHNGYIDGLIQLKNSLIISYGDIGIINIWSF